MLISFYYVKLGRAKTIQYADFLKFSRIFLKVILVQVNNEETSNSIHNGPLVHFLNQTIMNKSFTAVAGECEK